ncbi:hypothetical protein LAZ67_2003057 [Cordylochernes scorpioides]|uniref:ATP-dependent DNA helicase n=1 Tax=Cordylochernes scorpioides TaxID=51811 RepID=A0ABY6K2G5_9ARAC|nr:hypothetical protein LAZ67_2003057 [Cordylochernes scorpioides]
MFTVIRHTPIFAQPQLAAWLPELLEAKVAAHWRIPNSLKPASKVTGCATEQRASTWADMLNAAFHYNPALNYEQFTFLQIGHMDKQCLCIVLPLSTMVSGLVGLFCREGYMPTFKVQGQVYHRIGSVLPPHNSDSRQLQPAFLQVFFIGDSSAEVATRHRNFPITKPHIVSILQDMLHRHNPYVHLFKASIEKCLLLITSWSLRLTKHRLDTILAHSMLQPLMRLPLLLCRETVTDVTLFFPKEAVVCRGLTSFTADLWVPSAHKTVSCMEFYASLLMIRSRNPGITNWLLAFGDLTHQILVDINAKVESERLHYISEHQAQLRATEYIYLLDAIRTDRSHALIGRQVILPSSFVGSPRHMYEYAQDCMAYVRKYGRQDLSITFTCNPEWPEIKLMQFPTQGAFVRHDLVARIFQLKVTKLIDLITKGDVFGKPQCWCYNIEWQKRGLPHAHILLWLKEKIRPNQIDSIICAEIPNAEVDASLFRTVTKNIIHGPCGHGYPNPGCMERGRCQKKYPRLLLAETQTDRDGYPLYRRRRPEEGGFSFVKRVRFFTIENGVQVVRMTNVTIDNRFVVPYSSLLCRLFDAHINVESCALISAIKYICKYIYKGSDQSSFAVTGAQTESNEVLEYQRGRYISSNKAVWRILGFPIHRRHPMVQHLSVHLENGQRVYFTYANAALQAHRPPKTTLIEFFALCQRDNFAKTLLYVEVPVYYIWSASKSWQPRKQGTRIADQVAFASDAIGRKTFLINLLLTKVRGTGDISLSTASSGIAATLLHGGKTAHSTFKLPLELTRDEVPVCNLNADFAMGEVLTQCKFIVWDECTMAHRHALEAVDITLKDCRQDQRPMEGVVLLLAGELRQILPIIPRGTIADELHACLKASPLWSFVEKLILSTNMRAVNSGDPNSLLFSQFLLQLGSCQINDTDEASILTGCFQNEEVFIPRIPLIHDDKHSPLHFKRLQFPIRVSFAMSINKAQDSKKVQFRISLQTYCPVVAMDILTSRDIHPSYENIAIVLRSKREATVEEIQQILREEASRRNMRLNQSVENGHEQVYRINERKVQQFQPKRCFVCNKKGHLADDCWFRDKQKQGYQKKWTPDYRNHKYSREHSNNLVDTVKRRINEQAFETYVKEFEDSPERRNDRQIWCIDTGCTANLTPNITLMKM